MDFQQETQLVEDGLVLPGFLPGPYRFGSNEDDFVDPEDTMIGRVRTRPATLQNPAFRDSKREFKRDPLPNEWIHQRVCISLLYHVAFYFNYTGV